VISFDHTQTYTTAGRTRLDEGSARRRDFYLATQNTGQGKYPRPRWDSKSRSQQVLGRRPRPYILSFYPCKPHFNMDLISALVSSAEFLRPKFCNQRSLPQEKTKNSELFGNIISLNLIPS
jgi:hypothetical protein